LELKSSAVLLMGIFLYVSAFNYYLGSEVADIKRDREIAHETDQREREAYMQQQLGYAREMAEIRARQYSTLGFAFQAEETSSRMDMVETIVPQEVESP